MCILHLVEGFLMTEREDYLLESRYKDSSWSPGDKGCCYSWRWRGGGS